MKVAIYDRDYLTTLPLLQEKALEYSGGDWNKYNDDVGDAILRLLASTSHTVDYYFRKFLTSLILPNDDWDQKSLIWELTGYKPAYVRADYLMVQLYWPDCGLNTYVPLYQYTPFKITADGKEYTFLCAQDYIIPPLTTRTNVRLVNGELHTIEQDYTQIKNNIIKLSDEDIDYDLVTVIVSGTKWTQVRNVYYSPDTERIFSIHKESDGIYLYLHKTWQDYVDAYDTSFVIYFVQPFYDFTMFTDDCMTVEFKTELLTIEGEDVSQFYKIIPLLNSDEAIDATNLMPSTTEGNRAITVLDFEANAALFPGIASSKAYDWNTPEVCRTPFEVDLIACDSKGNLSEHMKQVLKSYLESISSPLLNVKVIAPKFAKQDILVLLDIGDYKGTLAEIELKKLVERTLKEFYKIGNLPPGRIVKTKELNSLLLHADSRIYFATTTFLNAPVRSPLLIPILGTVVTITSAEAFSSYDFGKGHDKAYIELRRYEFPDVIEKFDGVNVFFSYTIHANFISPIDKLPLQAFDFVKVTETKPVFDLPVSDFGVTSYFTHAVKTGGNTSGPLMAFVYETDGTSVLMKFEREISNRVQAQLCFDNVGGAFYVDPGIPEIPLDDDSIQEIKESLAKAFNEIPGLVDESGNPFEITADDITFPEYVPPTTVTSSTLPVGGFRARPLGAPVVDISDKEILMLEVPSDTEKSKLGQIHGDLGASKTEHASFELHSRDSASGTDTAVKANGGIPKGAGDGSHANEGVSIQIKNDVVPEMMADTGTAEERTFVYIPYNNAIIKELVKASETSSVRKISMTIRNHMSYSYERYDDFEFKSKGRYTPDPDAYGDLTFTSNVELDIYDHTQELVATKPDIYDEENTYNTPYVIKEKNANPLNWYFVNTSPVHSVGGTYEIGYGIYVGFNLLRDTGIYVETDVTTSRGFIYSAEMTPDDFYIADLY